MSANLPSHSEKLNPYLERDWPPRNWGKKQVAVRIPCYNKNEVTYRWRGLPYRLWNACGIQWIFWTAVLYSCRMVRMTDWPLEVSFSTPISGHPVVITLRKRQILVSRSLEFTSITYPISHWGFPSVGRVCYDCLTRSHSGQSEWTVWVCSQYSPRWHPVVQTVIT